MKPDVPFLLKQAAIAIFESDKEPGTRPAGRYRLGDTSFKSKWGAIFQSQILPSSERIKVCIGSDLDRAMIVQGFRIPELKKYYESHPEIIALAENYCRDWRIKKPTDKQPVERVNGQKNDGANNYSLKQTTVQKSFPQKCEMLKKYTGKTIPKFLRKAAIAQKLGVARNTLSAKKWKPYFDKLKTNNGYKPQYALLVDIYNSAMIKHGENSITISELKNNLSNNMLT